MDYKDLIMLPAADLSIEVVESHGKREDGVGVIQLEMKNNSTTVAFGNRLRLVNRKTGERVLPVIMNDNYVTLMPGEGKIITLETDWELCHDGVDLLLKQYNQKEKKILSVVF